MMIKSNKKVGYRFERTNAHNRSTFIHLVSKTASSSSFFSHTLPLPAYKYTTRNATSASSAQVQHHSPPSLPSMNHTHLTLWHPIKSIVQVNPFDWIKAWDRRWRRFVWSTRMGVGWVNGMRTLIGKCVILEHCVKYWYGMCRQALMMIQCTC